jgi:perosamine synthetase
MIHVAHPRFVGNEMKYVGDCIESGWVSAAGRYVDEFESAFARFSGTRAAATCANGTVALHLALLALGVGPGDEVIVPTLTYVASANAVTYCGATPVLVDSEPDTMNLDPAAVEAAITPRTKAVMAVHLYGHPADMVRLRSICRRHGVRLVEDAAEAHGASEHGRPVGSLGDIATFSFFGNKILTTGEGGMVTTDDAELDGLVRLFRGQGQDPERRYWFPMVGYNYRMTNVAAAIGLAQLESVDEHLADRRRVAAAYDERLADLGELLQLPATREGYTHVKWLYTVVLGDEVATDRDEVMARLAADGIESRPVFYPMHVMPVYEQPAGTFPVAERLGARGISLPTHGELSDADLDHVSERLRAVVTGA